MKNLRYNGFHFPTLNPSISKVDWQPKYYVSLLIPFRVTKDPLDENLLMMVIY